MRAEWDALPRGQLLCGTTEAESAAIGYEILRRVAGSDDKGYAFMNYVEPVGDLSKMMERFCETYLEPLYEYLDEHLEDRNIVLAELVRFKHLASRMVPTPTAMGQIYRGVATRGTQPRVRGLRVSVRARNRLPHRADVRLRRS